MAAPSWPPPYRTSSKTTPPPPIKKTCACPWGGTLRHKGAHGRDLLTAAGLVTLRRGYRRCRTCGLGHFAADVPLGVAGYLPRGAEQVVTRAGGCARRSPAAPSWSPPWPAGGSAPSSLRQVCPTHAAAFPR